MKSPLSFAHRFVAAWFASFVIAAGVLLTAPRAAHAQFEAWAARYDNAGHGADILNGVALDAQGNVYAVGNTASNAAGAGVLVLKYDRYGVRKWLRRIDGTDSLGSDSGKKIAVTADGAAVFVGANVKNAGAAGVDIAVVKLSGATGATTWTRVLSGTGVADSDDEIAGLALDASGNAYVAGTVEDAPNATRSFLTARITGANGAVAWSRRYAGTASENARNDARALGVDAARGNVFVTGLSRGDDPANTSDYATLRYNMADGAPVWTARYDSGDIKDEEPIALAVDGSGNPTVTGRAQTSDSRVDAVTIKYNRETGLPSWTARYDNPSANGASDDAGFALAVDLSGEAYVAILSEDSDSETTDIVTIRYSSANGTPVWERRYANGPGSFEAPRDIALLKGGSGVIVTGFSEGGIGPRLLNLRYSTGGTLAWASLRPKARGTDAQSDTGEAVAVDPSTGAAFVAATVGGLPPATSTDALVLKIAPYAHGASEASVGADGNTRVLWRKWDGGAVIRSYSSSGTVIAARAIAPPAGYRSRGLETGSDNKTRLLWENQTTGAVAVWTLSTNLATTETGFLYGASGYDIAALSVGSDNKGRLLWVKPDGTAAVWKLKAGIAGVESGTGFGPYASLTPFDIATGPTDNKTRLAWKNVANGAITLWTLNAAQTAPEQGKVYAAPAGYQFGGMNVASDNKPRFLWTRASDRAAAIWRLNPTGTALETGTVYGPIANVTPVALASGRTGPDTRTRLLWQYEDGRAALWVLSANDQTVSSGLTLGQPTP